MNEQSKIDAKHKKLIEKGFEDLKHNRLTPHHEVVKAIRELIEKRTKEVSDRKKA